MRCLRLALQSKCFLFQLIDFRKCRQSMVFQVRPQACKEALALHHLYWRRRGVSVCCRICLHKQEKTENGFTAGFSSKKILGPPLTCVRAAGMCAQVRLITLLTSCGTKDGGGMGEMFEVHLNSAAVSRFHSLLASVGAPKGAQCRKFILSSHRIRDMGVPRGLFMPACCLQIQTFHGKIQSRRCWSWHGGG